MIIARVSGRFQRSKGNLDDQIANLLSVAKQHRIEVAGIISHTGSGKDITWLASPVSQTKPLNAYLLGESMDRIMRARGFSLLTKNALYSQRELQRLQEMLQGITTVTLIHPDTKYTDVISSQTIRGITQKGKRQEIGFRKRRRDIMMEEAVEMILNYFTMRETAELLSIRYRMNVTPMTISR